MNGRRVGGSQEKEEKHIVALMPFFSQAFFNSSPMLFKQYQDILVQAMLRLMPCLVTRAPAAEGGFPGADPLFQADWQALLCELIECPQMAFAELHGRRLLRALVGSRERYFEVCAHASLNAACLAVRSHEALCLLP